MLARFRADEFVQGFRGGYRRQGDDRASSSTSPTLLPDEWTRGAATARPSSARPRSSRQFDLGVDGVILHGATPAELAPILPAYRAIRPASVRRRAGQPGLAAPRDDPVVNDVADADAELAHRRARGVGPRRRRSRRSPPSASARARSACATGITLDLRDARRAEPGRDARRQDRRRRPRRRDRVEGGVTVKEVGFYTELARHGRRRAPRVLVRARSPTTRRLRRSCSTTSRPRVQGDQAAAARAEQAARRVVNLAGLHGPRWSDAALSSMGFLDADRRGHRGVPRRVFADATEPFIERYATALGAADVATLRAVAARARRLAAPHAPTVRRSSTATTASTT